MKQILCKLLTFIILSGSIQAGVGAALAINAGTPAQISLLTDSHSTYHHPDLTNDVKSQLEKNHCQQNMLDCDSCDNCSHCANLVSPTHPPPAMLLHPLFRHASIQQYYTDLTPEFRPPRHS